MINRSFKLYGSLFIGVVCLTGCGAGTMNTPPKITYGNPNYKHAKELPQNKYDPLLDMADKINTPIEMSDDAFERLGDLMFAREKYFLAFLNYEKSLEKNKDNIRVDYKKGLALLGHGKTTQAASQFQLVLEKQPDFAQAYEGLGRINFSNKNYETGIINFKKALELDPLLWRSYNFLGNIYDGLGNHDLAIHQYKTALTLKPDAGFIYNNLGLCESNMLEDRVVFHSEFK